MIGVMLAGEAEGVARYLAQNKRRLALRAWEGKTDSPQRRRDVESAEGAQRKTAQLSALPSRPLRLCGESSFLTPM
jgi:hypothetical protein